VTGVAKYIEEATVHADLVGTQWHDKCNFNCLKLYWITCRLKLNSFIVCLTKYSEFFFLKNPVCISTTFFLDVY
jgi:hypothetical protein